MTKIMNEISKLCLMPRITNEDHTIRSIQADLGFTLPADII